MKLVIVGGVAAGASAATRARRLAEDAQIVLFERGPDTSFANCGLPYYLGGEIADRSKLLVATPERLRARFKIDVRVQSEVVAIDRKAKTIRVRDLAANREYDESYDKLLLAPEAARADARDVPAAAPRTRPSIPRQQRSAERRRRLPRRRARPLRMNAR